MVKSLFVQYLIGLAVAAHIKKEEVAVPTGWTSIEAADENTVIPLTFQFLEEYPEAIHEALFRISDPNHADYRKHLSLDQVKDITKPAATTLEAFKNWISNAGIENIFYDHSSATVHVPISQASELLQTTYFTFQHSNGGRIQRATEYSLPEDLHSLIKTVSPTCHFPRIPKTASKFVRKRAPRSLRRVGERRQAPSASVSSASSTTSSAAPGPTLPASCASAVTIDCIRTAYNMKSYAPTSQLGVAVASYSGDAISPLDLKPFLTAQRPEAVNTTINEIQVYGGYNGSFSNGMEATMDLELMVGLSYPLPVSQYQTGGVASFAGFMDDYPPFEKWINYTLNLPDDQLPSVISTSYGEDENDVPEDYARTLCDNFAKLSARGVSLIFSTGDIGVDSGDGNSCTTNGTTHFFTHFPATCYSVTAVGATANLAAETAPTSFSSGGGFSDKFARPSYQDAAVQGYLAKLDPTLKTYFNNSGRAYPDVAAIGQNISTVEFGSPTTDGGTSASAPIFASVIGLLNDRLAAKGEPPLGFLNPLIYGTFASAWNDITVGSNSGCGLTTAFPCTEGYDTVTGMGTPDFEKLLAIVERL